MAVEALSAAALWHTGLAIPLWSAHLLLLLVPGCTFMLCSRSPRQADEREVCGGAAEVLPQTHPGLLLLSVA